MTSPRVALVHDWLTGMRGGEKCLESLARLWPSAPIYTLVADRARLSPLLRRRRLIESPLADWPGAPRYFRLMLPWLPRLVAAWRFPEIDVLISSSHCVALGARPARGIPHVCYCHTPMRYAGDRRDDYLAALPRLARPLAARLLDYLRAEDRRAARRVTHFLANSQHVARRIRAAYGRESTVIHPPVNTSYFTPAPVARGDAYLVVSALVPYKRVDLAVAACTRLGRPLVVIGSGPERPRLERLAGPTVLWRGWLSNAELRSAYRQCRALLFPGEEDFGIVPVEAQACGAPVLALGRGGALETVRGVEAGAEATGRFFAEPAVDALIAAIEAFERGPVPDSQACRRNAERFNAGRFEAAMAAFVDGVLR